jgi:hypothetical protein
MYTPKLKGTGKTIEERPNVKNSPFYLQSSLDKGTRGDRYLYSVIEKSLRGKLSIEGTVERGTDSAGRQQITGQIYSIYLCI